MDCNLVGFSVHGILQAGILEWLAISFSRGSSWPRDWLQDLWSTLESVGSPQGLNPHLWLLYYFYGFSVRSELIPGISVGVGDSVACWQRPCIFQVWQNTQTHSSLLFVSCVRVRALGLKFCGPKHPERKWYCSAVYNSLYTDPMDCSLPGSSGHGIFQARVLEWLAISFSRGSSWLRDRTQVSCIASRHFTIWASREAPVRIGILPQRPPLQGYNNCLT